MNRESPQPRQTAEIFSLVVALALVLAIAGLSYRAWAAFSRESEELASTMRIVAGTNELLSSLKDAETGQRGYLLTGENRYLEPYRQAVTGVPAAWTALKAEVAGLPSQYQRVERLLPLVREKMDELGQTIELRRENKTEEALAIVHIDRGKMAMDQVRQLCADIQATANRRLTQYSERSRSSANQMGLIATIGSAFLFALLVLATIVIQRATLRRQQLIRDLQVSEGQTKEARDWLQTTLVSIGDGVIATDSEGRVVFLNPIAQQLTGWTEADAAGSELDRVFVIHNEETGASVENPVRRALREGITLGLANHTSLTAKDGRAISIDDSAAPIRNKQEEIIGVVLVFRDVSTAREREREQELSRLALASANRDLQQFAYAASHDLREPLRTIKIFGQMLEAAGPNLTEPQREHLAFILHGADRMEQLVDSLLEYSTAGAAGDRRLAKIGVGEVLTETLNYLHAAIKESGAVITHDALPSIVADPAHIDMVLQNLVGNAIKYRGAEPPRIHVSARKSGDEWIFSVADNGVGIRPEYHSSVFEIFKRLHNQSVAGNGIGLATCRRIVERYNGRIWVESELGKGSTFFFSMPAQAVQVPAEAQ